MSARRGTAITPTEQVVSLTEVVGRMARASNTTLLGRAEDGSLWIYKPVAGEQQLWDFPWKSLAAREVLAFELSEALSLGIVPETRPADGPYGYGSAQRFLDEDFEFDHRPLFQPTLDEALWPFALFDIIANNADRKLGHVLSEAGTGKLWAIDNGLTFHAQPKLRTVLWGLAGERVPDLLVESLEEFRADALASFTARIETVLTPAEAAAFETRVHSLLQTPLHPDPPSDRPPLPWPIW